VQVEPEFRQNDGVEFDGISLVKGRFKEVFGELPQILAFAPGRVNLIGEHTDYNGGFVMPVAIDKGIFVAASPTESPSQIISHELGEGTLFDTRDLEPLTDIGFTKYAAGMAWSLKDHGRATNLNAFLASNLPIGSGVSSSAAFEMAFGTIWNTYHGLEIEPKQLALLGQKCENHFVGVNSGIMDQLASACGKANQAMKIDTRNLEIEYASVPTDYSVMILDTTMGRELAGSAYNVRRAQCEEAARVMGVTLLREANLEMLQAHKSRLDKVVYRRANHVITEDARTNAFSKVLAEQDEKGIFALMRGSHLSLKDDYEVSSPELDAIVEAAWMSPGVVGARMTGAGFGGCAVALIHSAQKEEFAASVLDRYEKSTGKKGGVIACQVAEGARIIS
jgi:galactokinase